MSLSALPTKPVRSSTAIVRRMSMETYMVRIYTGPLSPELEYVSVEAEKITTADEVLRVAVAKLKLADPDKYELAEVLNTSGQLCKERRLEQLENPVRVQLLWPKIGIHEYDIGQGLHTGYRFYIRKKNPENSNRTSAWMEYLDPNPVDNFLTAFLKQPTSNKEYQDLCNLPDLNEKTLLENIKSRFHNSHIYTYVGSILIALNPFKFFPIYNPKYVTMYQNKRLGDLPPHIFAIADAAFYTMLRTKKNQCIVISGESGSGKTESTNLLLHHLTALSHKGLHGSGVEQTILGAGPVLEAFGNAKTVHNNNSSRFGKFIQVNYKENGMVHGAIVEKYLLEKSRIVSQAKDERNYHVFYYLLEGADSLEREKLHLGKPMDYFYLRQSGCCSIEEVDEANEFSRLKQSMELVGFSQVTQKRIFGVLSAVLHLGNVEFKKKGDQHHDESVTIVNPVTLSIVSKLLMVKEKTLLEALTQKKTVVGDETVVMTHKMEHAVATRDAMAKCLYGALFDWIVLKVNQALLAKKHNSEHQGNSIGVLDIFGFEDFGWNSFEQFCINYANEHLQYYFNQHIFKFEQEEYKKEGIEWMNIEFIDNTGCLELFSKKTVGLFSLLDEECNFPGASNNTLLSKFHHHHSRGNVYYEAPQRMEKAFVVLHYAGKVKYQVKDFREKNSDQIRMDIVANMKSSSLAFVRELMGVDPVAVLRWTIIKTLIKSVFAFIRAGKTYKERGGPDSSVISRRKHSNVDSLNIPDLNTSPYLSPGCKSPSFQTQHVSPRTSMHVPYQLDSHLCIDIDETSGGSRDSEILLSPNKRHSGPLRSPVDRYMSEDDAKVMRRATRVMMKNKSFKPRARPPTMFSDIKTLKAIANRTIYVGGKVNTKQKPPSVSAQFQWSLSRLMSTLNQANPFFIRCIKSNADKMPCQFNDVLVTRQLRYTGMLATVRIRQSGYNYRLTFEEFVKLYKILLPKGLASDKDDVAVFLESRKMNPSNYQIGKTKVFLREYEKSKLDNCLHNAIMERVITIQRWVKTKVERKNYLLLREQTIVIQKHVRKYFAQKKLELLREAILCIQRWYRGYTHRKSYALVRHSAIRIQAHTRGYIERKRFKEIEAELRHQKVEREAERERLRLEQLSVKQGNEDLHSSTSDEGVLLKENSGDELEKYNKHYHRNDSEESSGILDDSESDTLSEAKSRDGSLCSPPPTPTSQGPDINIESLPGNKDEYLSQSGRSSRVSNLSKVFQSPSNQSLDELDGRPSPDTIYVPRGSSARKRPPKMSPAPLAKQESFSDLDSPTTEIQGGSPLSEEQKRHIEETLTKRPGAIGPSLGSSENVHKSPFKWARDLVESKSAPLDPDSATLRRRMSLSSTLIRRTKSSIKMLRDMKSSSGGYRRKPSDDDELVVHPTTGKHSHPVGGVAVLPLSPKSPTKEENLALPAPDEHELKKPIQKKRRTRKEDKENRPAEKCWNVAKTSQWQYPEEFVIAETYELQLLDEFIGRKINTLAKDTPKKESQFDVVFKKCLKSFHTELKSTYSVVMQREGIKERSCNIKYRDLFANFEKIMDATCKEENVDKEFPKTICINAFRGYLDEFRNSVNSKKKESKFKKKRDRPHKREKQKKDVLEYQGHKFSQVQFGIPTFCELCTNIIWIMDKGHVCQICKYACHKKCTYKTTSPCKGAQDMNDQFWTNPCHSKNSGIPIGPCVNSVVQHFNAITQRIVGTKVFCVPLQSLVEPDEKIPVFMDNLIMLIETHGLFTEGIYRKSGAAPKINMLKTMLDSGVKEISIEEFPIHVLTSTLKTFFRELPEPVLTFEFYDEFLQASEIHDEKEAIQVLYSLIEKLPKVNHDVLERLIFHLSRVAQHEKTNKMSVNGLAIIFAPCLLRNERVVQAQDLLAQVNRQQIVLEMILQEQLRKIKSKLQDIDTLESAEATANERLSVVRASMRSARIRDTVRQRPSGETPSLSEDPETLEEEEHVIQSHIQSIRQERDILTNTLPMFEYRHSSDDEMLSTDDIESIDDAELIPDDGSFDTPGKINTRLTAPTEQPEVPQTEIPNKSPVDSSVKYSPTEGRLSKQRSLDHIEDLESMKTDHDALFPLKDYIGDKNVNYDSDSSCSPALRKKSSKKQLFESLDLHENEALSRDEYTRKKVGNYFRKSKHSSALIKDNSDTGSMEDVAVGHDTPIAQDSVLLRKPKRYDPEKPPAKLRHRYGLARATNSPILGLDSPARKKYQNVSENQTRVRKQSLPDISLTDNSQTSAATTPSKSPNSPEKGESSAARIRPILVADTKHVRKYSNLSVPGNKSDSEDEIMV